MNMGVKPRWPNVAGGTSAQPAVPSDPMSVQRTRVASYSPQPGYGPPALPPRKPVAGMAPRQQMPSSYGAPPPLPPKLPLQTSSHGGSFPRPSILSGPPPLPSLLDSTTTQRPTRHGNGNGNGNGNGRSQVSGQLPYPTSDASGQSTLHRPARYARQAAPQRYGDVSPQRPSHGRPAVALPYPLDNGPPSLPPHPHGHGWLPTPPYQQPQRQNHGMQPPAGHGRAPTPPAAQSQKPNYGMQQPSNPARPPLTPPYQQPRPDFGSQQRPHGGPYGQPPAYGQGRYNANPAATSAQSLRQSHPASSTTSSSSTSSAHSSAAHAGKAGAHEVRGDFKFGGEVKDMIDQLNRTPDRKKKGMFSFLTPADAKYNKHMADSTRVLKEYMVGNRNYTLADANGKTAGLLSMTVPPRETGTHVKIEGVASLPDTKGVGRAAVEQAIRLSLDSGLEGKVELRYLPGFPKSNSHDVYAGYGFVDAASIVQTSNGGEHWDNRMTLSREAARKFLAQSNGSPPRFV